MSQKEAQKSKNVLRLAHKHLLGFHVDPEVCEEVDGVHILHTWSLTHMTYMTHSEQGRKLKLSTKSDLQLSGGRQVQSAPDRHADAVTAVLRAEEDDL